MNKDNKKPQLIEISHYALFYSNLYVEILVPDNVNTNNYIKSVLIKEIVDFEDECYYWNVTGKYSYPELDSELHKISVSTPNNNLVVWLPKEELSYEGFDNYIASSLNLLFYEWDKYEDLYMQLPIDISVVQHEDASDLINTGTGYGSFLIQDKTTGESCWIDVVAVNEDELSWEFNQYIFGNNSIDIQARRFQDRIINNGDCDISCEIEEYIAKCNAHNKAIEETNDEPDITND